LSGLVPAHRLKEWRRCPGALPSRMRDHGGDSVPPDVRFPGKACVDGSSASNQPRHSGKIRGAWKWSNLTQAPSCEAGHMTAPFLSGETSKKAFARGAAPHMSHLRSLKGYDEPEILLSSIRQFCLIGADGGPSKAFGRTCSGQASFCHHLTPTRDFVRRDSSRRWAFFAPSRGSWSLNGLTH
jgi:hypothetical protein